MMGEKFGKASPLNQNIEGNHQGGAKGDRIDPSTARLFPESRMILEPRVTDINEHVTDRDRMLRRSSQGYRHAYPLDAQNPKAFVDPARSSRFS
jgi:hypothetical protein